jgi:AcrR family transcriptional regulator
MAKKPVRKPAARPASAAAGNGPSVGNDAPAGNAGDPVVAAFMELLAEKPIERIGFAEIAERAGVSLSELRARYGSTLAILAAQMKELDRIVLAGVDPDLADEPPRERLFDVLMRRIEALGPHQAAVRSLVRSAACNPGLAFALNGLAVRSQHWMLTAAGISAAGPRGMVRAQGLAVLFASVLRTFVDDDDAGHAKTMAALDRALARGQRWSGFLDGVCSIPKAVCRTRARRRPRDADEETIAA